MASLKEAFNFVVEKCIAENVRYSQDYREGQTINGLQYYDCSSLMYAALYAGGFYFGVSGYTPWFWTAIEGDELIKIGFSELDYETTEWRIGDILWRSGHTEMVYSLNPLSSAGARSARLPDADQVSVHSTSKSSWTKIYRCATKDDDLNGVPIPTVWYNDDTYLSESQKLNNAKIIWGSLIVQGWSEYSIAALLGNMDQESTINPGFSQRGGSGYGLVQWTPSSRWTTWADDRGYEYNDGNGQIMKIVEEMTESGQDEWYTTREVYGDSPPNGQYLLSREDYISNSGNWSIDYLTSAWLWEYERPPLSTAMEDYRRQRANYWYQLLHGQSPIPDPGFNLPIWLIWKIKEVNS